MTSCMSSVMYRHPVYNDDSEEIPLSTCMYGLPNLQANLGTQPVPSRNNNVGVDSLLADLERRQESILKRLEFLSSEVKQLAGRSQDSNITKRVTAPSSQTCSMSRTTQPSKATGPIIEDLVINASPSSPPYSLLVMHHFLSQQYRVLSACHTHSSARNDVPEKLKTLFNASGAVCSRNNHDLALTLIWKNVSHGAQLVVSPTLQSAVDGEANIARYLSRLLKPSYEDTDIVTATEVDGWLDQAVQLCKGSSKEKAAVLKAMNGKLGRSQWLTSDEMSLADAVLWSAIQQSGQAATAPANVKKWLQSCDNHPAFQLARQMC